MLWRFSKRLLCLCLACLLSTCIQAFVPTLPLHNNAHDSSIRRLYKTSTFSSSTAVSRKQSRIVLGLTKSAREVAKKRNNLPTFSFDSALAIIPPDYAWDALQRARYTARDPTYTTWPPNLRLFHPLPHDCDEYAMQIALMLEEYAIEPFTITLNRWSVVPHTEELHTEWLQQQQQYERRQHKDSRAVQISPEDAKIQALIAREEALGKLKLQQRRRRGLQTRKEVEEVATKKDNDDDEQYYDGYKTRTRIRSTTHLQQTTAHTEKLSPRELVQKQQSMYEEFNGPCVIVLEPDEDSAAKLCTLRNLILDKVFCHQQFAYISPTAVYDKSSVSAPKADRKNNGINTAVLTTEYRPVVPIGSFDTVTEAIRMARELRRDWEPLTFNITDLQFISRNSGQEVTDEAEGEDAGRVWIHSSQSAPGNNNAQSNVQFGCDALVSLHGVDLFDDDPEMVQEMTQLLCTEGYAGDSSNRESNTVDSSLAPSSADDESARALEIYLQQEEEDYERGTVMVMGRVLFFSGEMREYVGMPATSHVDGKDRF